jgi:hypothetical protein
MSRSIMASLALCALVFVGACDDDDPTGTTDNATVRFVNLTGTNLNFRVDGTSPAGFSNVAFGGTATCTTVEADDPDISFTTVAGTAVPGFTTTLTAGGNYTIIAYPGAGGTTQFLTVPNTFTPTSGQAGLRVVNLASGTGPFDVYVTAPGAALGTASTTGVSFGNATSSFFSVPSGSRQIRITNAGSQTVTLDAGNLNFTAGQNAILFVAPPATGSTTLRTQLITGC